MTQASWFLAYSEALKHAVPVQRPPETPEQRKGRLALAGEAEEILRRLTVERSPYRS